MLGSPALNTVNWKPLWQNCAVLHATLSLIHAELLKLVENSKFNVAKICKWKIPYFSNGNIRKQAMQEAQCPGPLLYPHLRFAIVKEKHIAGWCHLGNRAESPILLPWTYNSYNILSRIDMDFGSKWTRINDICWKFHDKTVTTFPTSFQQSYKHSRQTSTTAETR